MWLESKLTATPDVKVMNDKEVKPVEILRNKACAHLEVDNVSIPVHYPSRRIMLRLAAIALRFTHDVL